jgi:hypothetical protein
MHVVCFCHSPTVTHTVTLLQALSQLHHDLQVVVTTSSTAPTLPLSKFLTSFFHCSHCRVRVPLLKSHSLHRSTLPPNLVLLPASLVLPWFFMPPQPPPPVSSQCSFLFSKPLATRLERLGGEMGWRDPGEGEKGWKVRSEQWVKKIKN